MYYLIFLCLVFSINTKAQTYSNQFNPAMSVNTLMLFQNSKVDNDEDGFQIQEVELQFSTDVDAYLSGHVSIGIHPSHDEHEEHDEELEEEEHEDEHAEHESHELHLEEAYVKTIAFDGMGLRAGKFLLNFGKYNNIHTHAQPFIYRSYSQRELLSDEGLSLVGVGGEFLLPLPWFSDFSLQIVEPSGESFGESKHEMVYVSKLKNLWDLSDELTLELGLSHMSYSPKTTEDDNEFSTKLNAADLTFKWRPIKKSVYKSIVWSTEVISKQQEGEEELEAQGVASFLRYQFAKRWFIQV